MREKKPLIVVLLLAVAFLAYWFDHRRDAETASTAKGDTAILKALSERRSKVWLEGEGEVVHLLPDDREPPRHQLFLVKLASGHVLKLSHNVDLAPKVPLVKGEKIRFRGRLEWNEKGGVVHWTHRDPQGRHQGGWLEYGGKTYK